MDSIESPFQSVSEPEQVPVKRRSLVFVSHRSTDEKTSDLLVRLLQKALALKDDEVLFTGQVMTSLEPGEKVDDRLKRELLTSVVVVSVATRSSLRSAYPMMEMGVGWATDRLIVTTLCRKDAATLPSPLVADQAVRLDHRLHLHRLIDTVGRRIGRASQPSTTFESEMTELLKRTCRIEANRRRVMTSARTVVAALAIALFATSLFSRQNVKAKVYEYANGVGTPLQGHKIFAGDERVGVKTDEDGFFTFSVWNALPLRHRITFEDPKTKRHFVTYWRGPWPLQSLSQETVQFGFDPSRSETERFFVASHSAGFLHRLAGIFSPTVLAAGSGNARETPAGVAAATSDKWAVGIFVDAVATPVIPGYLFMKAHSAFFRVSAGGQKISEDSLLTPSELERRSLLPVESNRKSWIPINQSRSRFGRLLAGLPAALVASIDRDNRISFRSDITFSLISNRNDTMGTFVLQGGVRHQIGSTVDLSDSAKGGATLTIKPEVIAPVDLVWEPNDQTAPGGANRVLRVRAADQPPFAFEFKVTQQALNGKASALGLPPSITLSPSAPSAVVPVELSNAAGKIRVSSTLPKSLYRPQQGDDDADITVKPAK